LALLCLDEGDHAGALAAINRRMADRDAFIQEGRVLLLPAQVTIGLAAGDLGVARRALSELEEAAAQCGAIAVVASASVARGALAFAEGRAVDAIAPLREGWRQWCEVAAPFDAAQARTLLGQAYAQTGDQSAARLELEGAQATFAELGAPLEERRLARLLVSFQAGVREIQTFMFTDIVDSTRLAELLGDDGWNSLLSWHDRTVRACVTEHGGREIKHEGDGFFIAFPDPRSALDSAVTVQRTLDEHRQEHGFAPRVRIGIHAAEATRRGGDFFGQGVHVAARVAAAATAGRILTSAATVAEAGGGYSTFQPQEVELKGFAEPLEVVEVDWR
jgi:class 3 adenylate cyclase